MHMKRPSTIYKPGHLLVLNDQIANDQIAYVLLSFYYDTTYKTYHIMYVGCDYCELFREEYASYIELVTSVEQICQTFDIYDNMGKLISQARSQIT